MKKHYLIFSILMLAVFFSSCGDKEEKKVDQKQAPKQEVVEPDTTAMDSLVQEEPPSVEEEGVPAERVVTVKNGQWLYDIARKEYGSMHAWRKIYEANKDRIKDPNMIYPNQELIIPE